MNSNPTGEWAILKKKRAEGQHSEETDAHTGNHSSHKRPKWGGELGIVRPGLARVKQTGDQKMKRTPGVMFSMEGCRLRGWGGPAPHLELGSFNLGGR